MTVQHSKLSLTHYDGKPSDWNHLVLTLPGAHILQSWEWGSLKGRFGWEPSRLVWWDANWQVQAAAQVLIRTVRLGGFGPAMRVAYAPRGPLQDWENTDVCGQVIKDLIQFARSRGAIFIKIDPELIKGQGIPGAADAIEYPTCEKILGSLTQNGWIHSSEQIQFRNTVWLKLDGSEEDWLERMKQKTRYNIRLASRKGVQVRFGNLNDIALLYRMYAETSLRDGFVIRSEEYYRQVWSEFFQAGMADFLIAEVDGEAAAGLILFTFGSRAWYLYGMSRDAHREKMPNHLLQWEAMRRAKARGCRIYDLWGAPDDFGPQDSMWGVYRFKEGLGGQVVRTAGAFDFPVQKLMYPLYTRILPRILNVMRKRGVEQTRREVTL